MAKTYKINEDIFHSVKGEGVLFLVSIKDEDECYYKVDGLAAEIFLGLKSKKSLDEIKAKILSETDVEEEQLNKDIEGYLEFLKSNNILLEA